MNLSEAIVNLARHAVETYCREQQVIDVPQDLPERLSNDQSGVFVTVEKQGSLRGCMGSFKPTRGCIAAEIINNAINAALRDPRFPAVAESELDQLEYTVSLLSEPQPVDSEDELDPEKYGVIVSAGQRRGLLLPDLDGVDSVAEQVAITRRKAGIGPSEPVSLQRFEVEKYS